MGLTHFPNGVSSFGVPVIGAGPVLTTGNIFFVDSGSANAADDTRHGKNTTKPFATLDFAIGQCTANNGDVIFVMPGHAENLTANVTFDVAGVRCVGLGWGASRPTFTYDADVTITITAASCWVSGLRAALGTTQATVAAAFTMSAADSILEACETVIHATSQFTSLVSVTAVERVSILNNVLRTLETASATSGLLLTGCDEIRIVGNLITGHFASAGINNAGGDEALNALIMRNIVHNYSSTGGDLAVDMDDAATGLMIENYFAAAIAGETGYDEGAMLNLETYIHDSAADSYGIVPGTAVA